MRRKHLNLKVHTVSYFPCVQSAQHSLAVQSRYGSPLRGWGGAGSGGDWWGAGEASPIWAVGTILSLFASPED